MSDDFFSGWVKLHRRSLKHPLFTRPMLWHLWTYLLLNASHEDRTIIWGQEEFLIERGSLIFGRKRASLETGISEQTIRSTLKTLINLEMVEKSTTRSTNRFSYLTICNYEHYQDLSGPSNQQLNQQATSRQPAGNQQATTYKELKELKELKERSSTPLPPQGGSSARRSSVRSQDVEKILEIFNQARRERYGLGPLQEGSEHKNLKTCLRQRGLEDCERVARWYTAWAAAAYMSPHNCFAPTKFAQKLQSALDEEALGQSGRIERQGQIVSRTKPQQDYDEIMAYLRSQLDDADSSSQPTCAPEGTRWN